MCSEQPATGIDTQNLRSILGALWRSEKQDYLEGYDPQDPTVRDLPATTSLLCHISGYS